MHTIASSLLAIAQYFWRIRTSVLHGNQQKFNIEAVNDYPPIFYIYSIRSRIVAADSIRYSIRTEISDSQVSTSKLYYIIALHCITLCYFEFSWTWALRPIWKLFIATVDNAWK